MADAFVHPADDDQHRRVRGQHDVAERGQAEGERDRNTREYRPCDDDHEEDHQVGIAELPPQGLQQRHHDDDRDHQPDGGRHLARPTHGGELQQGQQRHGTEPGGHRGHAPGVRDVERRRENHCLLAGILPGVRQHQQQERQRGRGREDVEKGASGRRKLADDGGHAHVFAALEGHGRAQHRQPQEKDRGDFVRPDQRVLEQVASHDARQQHGDLGGHQQRDRHAEQAAELPLRGCGPAGHGALRRPLIGK